MPAWINKPHRDTSIYDFQLIDLPFYDSIKSIGRAYRCKKTNIIVTSEALPRTIGKKIFVKLGGEWKEEKTEEVRRLICVHRVISD